MKLSQKEYTEGLRAKEQLIKQLEFEVQQHNLSDRKAFTPANDSFALTQPVISNPVQKFTAEIAQASSPGPKKTFCPVAMVIIILREPLVSGT